MTTDTALICPRCELPLKEVRTSGSVFWACDNCGGRAATIELLRNRFTPESINPLWLHAMRGEWRSGVPCPSCRHPMIDVALSDRAEINVDVCRRCHLVWFDTHEGDMLLPRRPQTPAPELPQKARETLAIAEVERLAKEAEGSDLDSVPPDESWKQIAAFLGVPVEFDTVPHTRRPWATWLLGTVIIAASLFAFTRLHEMVTEFGLIPRGSHAPARPHVCHFIFSARRNHSPRRQYVFSLCLWRRRGKFSPTASLSPAHRAGGVRW